MCAMRERGVSIAKGIVWCIQINNAANRDVFSFCRVVYFWLDSLWAMYAAAQKNIYKEV
eukprot:m.59453 g.59453  ORF g.59453 m.59453 type:complete len:59 (+) comp15698_c0_seq3:56-232(+)